MAGTLFPEKWNEKQTGYQSFDDWVEGQLGQKISEIPPRQYEEMYRIPYSQGWYYNLTIRPEFREVLSWTKHNEVFTTGLRETNDWRAEYLIPKTGFDFRPYFQKVVSTFDYGETNQKTKEMVVDYLEKKHQEGYRAIVYADDKLANCQMFIEAMKLAQHEHPDFSYRVYQILNNDSGLQEKEGYFTIGGLNDLLVNEKK
jgi:hypothetical protein